MARWSNNDRTALGILRNNAGLSREAAATTMNLSLSTFIRYETGESDIPMGIAELMAILYRVPFDEIRNAIQNVKETRGINSVGVYPTLMKVRAKEKATKFANSHKGATIS